MYNWIVSHVYLHQYLFLLISKIVQQYCQLFYLNFQGTASESTLIALLSARTKMIRKLMKTGEYKDEGQIISKLVAYCSDQV